MRALFMEAGSQGEIPNSVNRWNAEGKKESELAELSSCEDDVDFLKMRIAANRWGGIATWYRTFRVAIRPSITLRSSVFSASKHLQFHRPNVKCFIGFGVDSLNVSSPAGKLPNRALQKFKLLPDHFPLLLVQTLKGMMRYSIIRFSRNHSDDAPGLRVMRLWLES